MYDNDKTAEMLRKTCTWVSDGNFSSLHGRIAFCMKQRRFHYLLMFFNGIFKASYVRVSVYDLFFISFYTTRPVGLS